MRLTARAAALALPVALVMSLAAGSTLPAQASTPSLAAERAAPRLADPSATGARLAERYLGLLKSKDAVGLDRFLAPEFQVQRADGSGASKAEYLRSLPTITDFVVTDAVGTQKKGTLVVRYLANVAGVTNGKAYSAGAAPRLSTFTWDGRRWQLSSHANFNALQGDALSLSVQVLLDKATRTVLDQPLAYPTARPAELSVSILTIAPGEETGWHVHEAPLLAYVMSGSVQVTYDGGIVKDYPTGTPIVEAVGTAHNGRNVGSQPVELLVINIGAEGVANTIRL